MIDRRTFIGGCVAAGAGAALSNAKTDYLSQLMAEPIECNEVWPDGRNAAYDDNSRIWVCECHPWLEWPHGNCPGPGMPAEREVKMIFETLPEFFSTETGRIVW